MEEIVLEDLREKYLDAIFSEQLDVRAGGAQRIHVADRYAVNALLNQHFHSAEVPVNLGHVEHIRALKVAFQLGSVCSLAHEIEFVDDRALVFRDHFERSEALTLLPESVGQAGNEPKHFDIALDFLSHAGPKQFDDYLGTVR